MEYLTRLLRCYGRVCLGASTATPCVSGSHPLGHQALPPVKSPLKIPPATSSRKSIQVERVTYNLQAWIFTILAWMVVPAVWHPKLQKIGHSIVSLSDINSMIFPALRFIAVLYNLDHFLILNLMIASDMHETSIHEHGCKHQYRAQNAT